MAQPTGLFSGNASTTKMGTGLSPVSASDPRYQSLYDANPYRNMTYHQSAWQRFLSGLGFRTDYDRWLEDAQVNSAEYDAQVASIIQQNEFNSPGQQASRMREAGQNPDLLGTSGVSESASPVQDVNGMTPGVSDEFSDAWNKVTNFASGIMSFFQIGMGLAKDFQTFKTMQNAINGQDVELANKFMRFANDYVLAHSPAVPFPDLEEFDNHVLALQDDMRNLPRFFGMNRHSRRVWNSVVSHRYFNSDEFRKMTENWLASSKNMDEYSKTKQNFHDVDDGSDQWKDFNILAKNLGDLNNDLWKAVADSQKKTAENDLKFQNALDPTKQANLMNTQADFEIQHFSVEKKINSTMERIVNDLEKQASDGDLLASGLLLAMQIFRMSNFSVGSKIMKFGLKGF